MIRVLCLILIHWSTSAICQEEIVDPKNVNQTILNKYVLQEVNALRKRKRIDTLVFDRTLLNASQDHADYMADEEVLTHIQKVGERREPMDRVKFYGGTHGLVGENVQLVDINKLLKKAKNKLTYVKLAKEIVTVWKKSKTHNTNMINPGYAGVATTYRFKDGNLYCCQLLASKAFKDHYRYSPGADLFVKNKKECGPCKRVKKKIYKNEVNLGWYTVSNDSIYYMNTAHYLKYRWYSKNKNRYRISSRKSNLNKIFKSKGVLTMDLIHHRQIDCSGNSSFHNSLYHDGYYLDFLTKKRILEDDLNPDKELIKVYVGMKPTFRDTFFQVDFHYMKRWRPCMQNSTIFVSPDHLLPREYFVIPKPTVGLDKNIIIEDSVLIRIPFKRNQTSEDTSIFQPLIVSMDSLVRENREIQKISFTGVASIEGSEKSNEKLFLRRGQIIEDYLRRYYKEIVFEKRFFENFDDFRSGLTSLGYQDLVGFSDDSLRIFANENKNKDEVSQLLDETRFSTISIIYRDYVPIQSGSYGMSVKRLEELITQKNQRELVPLYQIMAHQAIDGDESLQDSLQQLEIPDDEEFSQLNWYDFILNLNLEKRRITVRDLNELKRKSAIPTNGDYLEYRILFNIFNRNYDIDVTDYDTVLTTVRSGKQKAWIESLKLIMDVQNYLVDPRLAAPIILNNVLKKKFNVIRTYFVCQYFIEWGLTVEPYILLSKFARSSGQIPKLYKQYIKLGYFLQQFEKKREWKKIKRSVDILAEGAAVEFCDLFKWNQMGVRALQKKEIAILFCDKCATKSD